MMVYEFRQNANEAFDLLEEALHNNKKTKMALCELHDCLANCCEEIEDYPEYEEDGIYGDQNYAEIGTVEVGSINYRDDEDYYKDYQKDDEYNRMHKGMRRGMRSGMRKGMREDYYDMPKRSHKGLMHTRRNRAGRYSY